MAGILILLKEIKLMRYILVIIILGVVFISCKPSKTSGNKKVEKDKIVEKPMAASLNGNWQLQMLFATDNNWTKAPNININLSDHTFSGNSGCNIIKGKFTLDDNYISFDKNILSTKMACPGSYEKTFLSALLKINKYTINKDGLELGQGEIVLMKFKRI